MCRTPSTMQILSSTVDSYCLTTQITSVSAVMEVLRFRKPLLHSLQERCVPILLHHSVLKGLKTGWGGGSLSWQRR